MQPTHSKDQNDCWVNKTIRSTHRSISQRKNGRSIKAIHKAKQIMSDKLKRDEKRLRVGGEEGGERHCGQGRAHAMKFNNRKKPNSRTSSSTSKFTNHF